MGNLANKSNKVTKDMLANPNKCKKSKSDLFNKKKNLSNESKSDLSDKNTNIYKKTKSDLFDKNTNIHKKSKSDLFDKRQSFRDVVAISINQSSKKPIYRRASDVQMRALKRFTTEELNDVDWHELMEDSRKKDCKVTCARSA